MLFIFHLSVILPWFTVREVKVDIEIVRFPLLIFKSFMHESIIQPSPKVAIIRFERGMQQGLLARVGRSSIMEYHAFGIISYASILLDAVYPHRFFYREGQHAKEHYLICGVQGDFTRSLVKDPPTHLWTRQLKVLT